MAETEALLDNQQPQAEEQPQRSYGSVEDHESSVPEPVTPTISGSTRISGILFVIFSGWSFTAANVIQKIICPSLNYWSLLLIRSMIQTLLMGIYLYWKKEQNVDFMTRYFGPKDNRIMVCLQGIFGGLLLLAIFVAVKHLPLGNVSAIIFCTPVATFVFAIFMLKEKFGGYRSLISIMMIAGVLLITRPTVFFPSDEPLKNSTHHHQSRYNPYSNDQCIVDKGHAKSYAIVYYFVAIFIPILSAIISIWNRLCQNSPNPTKNTPIPVLMFWFALGSFIVALSGCAILQQFGVVFNLNKTEYGFTFLIVILGMLGNFFYTFAVRRISPTEANVYRSLEVVLNYVLQICLEHMIFHPTDTIGVIFLILAGITIYYEETIMKRFFRCRWL